MRLIRCGWYLGAVLAICWASQCSLLAQIGPPGARRRNYPLGGLGVPMPNLPQVNYKGKVQKIDDKRIVVALYDGRTAIFQRSGKTKFYKDAKEVKAAALQVGDPVSVDAAEDPQAYLDALKVTFDSSPPQENAKAEESPNSPRSIQYDANGRPTLRTRNLPEVPPADETTPGPGDSTNQTRPPFDPEHLPTLKRRGAAEQGTSETEPSAGIPSLPSPALPADQNAPQRRRVPTDSPPRDPLLEKARSLAVSSGGKLPDLICQEIMTRSARDANTSGWQKVDVVSADVVYQNGEETHRNLKVNDQPAGNEQMAGAWPIAKLVSTVSDLLSTTGANFQSGGETNLVDLKARVYDFEIKTEDSQWTMRMGSQSINAAYGGTVWIDKETGRVLRLEMQAHDLPAGFPLDKVETDVEYSLVRLGDASLQLPSHVETTGCQRGTQTCSRNVMEFRSYRSSPDKP